MIDDTINRRAAIDALSEAYWDKNIQSSKDDPCIVDAMTDWAIRQIKALPSAQQWIPVSEGLPKEKGEYIVTYHPCYWDDVKAEIKVGIDSFCGKASWAKRKHQRVIAWMPKPKPYKEDKDGTEVC